MGGGPLGILLYQMRYSGRCSVFYIELLLEYIDREGGQNSNHIVVDFPTSGWVSNQWFEIHPWWVNFQPFTLVGLGAVVRDNIDIQYIVFMQYRYNINTHELAQLCCLIEIVF